jgi:hypothetical protein
VNHSRWSVARAQQWASEQAWLVGCNYLPATAINQIEMWAEASFDPETIDRELDLAEGLGFNTLRVYLHDQSWREGQAGFLDRVDQFLALASGHGMKTLLVLFDDCWHEPRPGSQPAPRPGVHNSGWARSPGRDRLLDRSTWDELESYVLAVAHRFGEDTRIIGWDVYNEVTNSFMPYLMLEEPGRTTAITSHRAVKAQQDTAAIELMTQAFGWLRRSGVSQPLTAGSFSGDQHLNAILTELSDIISFHHYRDGASLERLIANLSQFGRPLWCTEYLNRRVGCSFASHLPILRAATVGCWNWGLVDGKSQTKYAWTDPPGGPEPTAWFHDIFHADGSSHDPSEVKLIKRETAMARR